MSGSRAPPCSGDGLGDARTEGSQPQVVGARPVRIGRVAFEVGMLSSKGLGSRRSSRITERLSSRCSSVGRRSFVQLAPTSGRCIERHDHHRPFRPPPRCLPSPSALSVVLFQVGVDPMSGTPGQRRGRCTSVGGLGRCVHRSLQVDMCHRCGGRLGRSCGRTPSEHAPSRCARKAHCGALCRSGRVLVFGENRYGQLGLGDFVSTATPRLCPVACAPCHPTSSGDLAHQPTRQARRPDPRVIHIARPRRGTVC